MSASAESGSRPVKNPWEQRETAVSSGLDPDSVTGRSARRRVGDAGLGRAVVVPIYLRRRASAGLQPRVMGVLVRLSPGGGIAVNWSLLPTDLGHESAFWVAVHRAVSNRDAVTTREGWTRVLLTADPDITILLTDLGLPGMSGRQLVEQALKLRPALKVIIASGYARPPDLPDQVASLRKPFDMQQLKKALES